MLEAEMESARDGLVAVTFVSHVRQEGKVIELYDESIHMCNLEPGKAFTAHTAPRRKWSMRCDGSTLEVFPVPAAGATFELGADYNLPTRHSRRARAGTHTTVYDPDANAERPQWGGRRA